MRLLTIPHTGTHWLKKLVGRMGVDARHHHLFNELPAWAGKEGCVVTLRDPLLSRITTLNRDEPYGVEVWRLLIGLDAHFVVLEDPDLVALAEYVGGRVPDEVPPPLNVTNHDKGLKAEYMAGVIPDVLQGDAEWLAEHMTDFFRSHGYDLPWMP